MATGSNSAGAGLAHAVNWLRNGSLNRIFRGVRYTEYDTPSISDQPASEYTSQTATVGATRAYDAFPPVTLDVGGNAPTESLMANWNISGAQAQFSTEPRDPVSNERIAGRSGKPPTRVTLLEAGEILMTQELDPFTHLLDRPITLFAYVGRDAGSMSIRLEIDYGNSTVESIAVPSSAYGAGGILRFNTVPPFDAERFVVQVRISGAQNQSAYLGQMGLYLGQFDEVRFVEDIIEQGRPRGECAFYWGFPAPAGYRTICEEDNLLIFHTTGDAQVDGKTQSAVGGSRSHNHRGRTATADAFDNPQAGGAYVLGRNHYHFVNESELNPPNFKILIIERI